MPSTEEQREPTSLADMIRMEAEAAEGEPDEKQPEGDTADNDAASSDEAVGDDPGGDDQDGDEPSGEEDQEPEAGAEAGTPARDLISRVSQKYGLNLDHYRDDDQLLEGLVSARRKLSERNVKAQVLDTLVQRYGTAAVESWLRGESPSARAAQQQQSQQHPQQAQQQVSPEQERIDSEVLRQVTIDQETGNLVPMPGAPPDAVEKAQRLLRRREDITTQLASDPQGFFMKMLGPIVPQIEQRAVQQMQAQQYAQQSAGQFQGWIQQNAESLFVGGDPQNGMTEYGSAMAQEMDRLAAAGVRDPNQQLALAYDRITDRFFPPEGQSQQSQQQQPQKQKQVAAKQGGRTLPTSERARHAPSVSSRGKAITLDDIVAEEDTLEAMVAKARQLGVDA